MSKKLYICNHCGGDNITFDAIAIWDKISQSFGISHLLDCENCEDCKDETKTIEVTYGTD